MIFKNWFLIGLSILIISITSCNNGLEEIPLTDAEIYANDVKIINDFLESKGLLDSVIVTKTGLRYVILTEGNGYNVDSLDVPKISYNGKLFSGSSFTSPGEGEFTVFGSQLFNTKGVNEGLDSMRVGSKHLVLVPSKLGYGKSGFSTIPANTPFYYEIEVLELQREKIDNWVLQNNYQNKVTTLPSGLRYIMLNDVPGTNITRTNDVRVYYEGRLLYGNKKFDGNFGASKTFDFQLATSSLISGWEEGVTYLSKGDSALIVIPSPLGYGSQGSGSSIPPNSPLVFTMKVVDVQ